MESYGAYKAACLRQVLDGLEKSYGLNSEEFMAARAAGDDDRLAGVPGFTRHAWADVYDELHELDARRGGFAGPLRVPTTARPRGREPLAPRR